MNNGWISVDERKPGENERYLQVIVLIKTGDGDYWRLAGQWLPAIGNWAIGGIPGPQQREMGLAVVAWQPMPPLPDGLDKSDDGGSTA